jgi:hypothetical protein
MSWPLARKLRSVGRLPVFTILWLPAIWILLGLSRAAILAVSFKRLSGILGRRVDRLDFVPAITPHQTKRVIQIRKLISAAARNTPWVSNCFPQAIVARILLGIYRIPYALYFGLRRDFDTADLLAHAWVMSGDESVCGVLRSEIFQPVGCYGCQTWKDS